MAVWYEPAIELFQTDTITAVIILISGFLLCHLIHAVRYGFFEGYGGLFDKIKKFFKILFFLEY